MARFDMAAALRAVEAEVSRAEAKFPPFHSAHEGWAVIMEEVDELWDMVRRDSADSLAARRECIQVAAMAIRFMKDLGEGDAI